MASMVTAVRRRRHKQANKFYVSCIVLRTAAGIHINELVTKCFSNIDDAIDFCERIKNIMTIDPQEQAVWLRAEMDVKDTDGYLTQIGRLIGIVTKN